MLMLILKTAGVYLASAIVLNLLWVLVQQSTPPFKYSAFISALLAMAFFVISRKGGVDRSRALWGSKITWIWSVNILAWALAAIFVWDHYAYIK